MKKKTVKKETVKWTKEHTELLKNKNWNVV